MAARTLAPLIAIALAASLALTPACGSIQPEVGERLPACVDADSNPGEPVNFKLQIRPIMNGIPDGPKPCASCHYHSTGTMDGLNATQLDLESVMLMKKGGTRTAGTTIVPFKPCSSAIVQKLRGTFEGARMPRGGPYWSPAQIQLMTDWIFEGANAKDDE